ncbi:MAG: replicative DNA helicase [Veillonella sp.]|nr:replicative DNA helicase [Veillonella sp.]
MDVRIPPHNLDAEKAVLGALLTNGSNMGAVVDTVTSILLEIVHANKTADFITVGEELDRRKRLDAVGGLAYITSLANESVSYNVEEHAKIISEKAQLRRLIDAGNKIVGMTYAGEDEPTAILNKAEQMVLDVSGQTQSESSFAAIGEVVLSNLDKLNALQQHDGAITGVPTGFKDVDHIFNGLQKSDLILVAARPAMGKTAFTLNIAQNVTMLYDKTVAFFSLEMGKEQLVGRILSSVAGVSSEKLRRANMDPADWEKVIAAADRMSKSKLFIDDTPGLTVQDMRSKLRRLKVEHAEISRNLKLIAREFNVPVIALSQLSRSVESRPDKRPVLSDLRESGSLEQDADIVIFLYRDKYYDENSEKGDNAEVLIRKHRNGSVGTVELQFVGELTQFRDVEFRDLGPEQ